MQTLGQDVDPQIVAIKAALKPNQTFYQGTRCIHSEWPKMATRGNGKGKGKTSKACQDQDEYDAYMKGGKVDSTELENTEA